MIRTLRRWLSNNTHTHTNFVAGMTTTFGQI